MSVVDRGYESLANAVIEQAVHDYRSLLASRPPTPDVNIPEIEGFFKSQWFRMLTKVDGSRLMRKIREEFK